MKNIIVVGAGFGGIACARSLASNKNFKVTLIDKNPYHVVHGNLYEVASSPEELTSFVELNKSVNIPLAEIFKNSSVNLVEGEVSAIDQDKRQVKLAHASYNYDYLVLALGSSPNFFNISGAKENSLTLQTAADAIKIRNHLENIIELNKNKAYKREVKIIIAGGGVAAVELSAELSLLANFLCWELNFPRQLIKLEILEMANQLLPGFNAKVVNVVEKRLAALSVETSLNTTITKVDTNHIYTKDETLDYDILVWTCGVKANPLPIDSYQKLPGGRAEVDQNFALLGSKNIFVIGDSCGYQDTMGKIVPGTAGHAILQGKHVAKTITHLSNNSNPLSYSCKHLPFLIPVGGKWAVYSSARFTIAGRLGFLIRQLVWMRYFISILGFNKGLHWLLRTDNLYQRHV